jgi:hypothetical protein
MAFYGAIWILAAVVWYSAVLYGSTPHTTMLDGCSFDAIGQLLPINELMPMEKRTRLFRALSFIGFALSLQIPSLGVIHKYLGIRGIVVYLLATTILVLLLDRFLIKIYELVVKDNLAIGLAALTFLCLVIGYLFVYPIANSGVVGGGSDADDALNIAAWRLLHGQYPYYSVTYLGNPIAPLPGAVLLSVPFVLLGNSAHQNLFWLAAFFAAIHFYLKDIRSALLLIWACLVLSPVVLNNIAAGVDEISNSIYVLIFMSFVVRNVPDPSSPFLKKIASAIILGIGLSSRSNFLLLLPLSFGTLVQNKGWRDVGCLKMPAREHF